MLNSEFVVSVFQDKTGRSVLFDSDNHDCHVVERLFFV